MFAPRIKITNNGTLKWESIQIIVTDTITAVTKTHTDDVFEEYTGCGLALAQNDLTPGEISNVTAVNDPFNYDLTGNPIQATIKVCSENGLGGTCRTKTITFTP